MSRFVLYQFDTYVATFDTEKASDIEEMNEAELKGNYINKFEITDSEAIHIQLDSAQVSIEEELLLIDKIRGGMLPPEAVV